MDGGSGVTGDRRLAPPRVTRGGFEPRDRVSCFIEGAFALLAGQRLSGFHRDRDDLGFEVDVHVGDAVDLGEVAAYTRGAARRSSHAGYGDLIALARVHVLGLRVIHGEGA